MAELIQADLVFPRLNPTLTQTLGKKYNVRLEAEAPLFNFAEFHTYYSSVFLLSA
jgi:hypothetical protein